MIGSAIAMALAAASPAAAAPLSVCLAAHNLPLSTSHPPWGIDGEVARAIGEKLGRPVDFLPISEDQELPDAALLDGKCDMAMGAAVEADGLARHSNVPGLRLSVPYYTAGYMIVQRRNDESPATIAEIGDERIAVEMVSLPIYTLKQRGKKVYALDDMDAVVKAVADGRARYGYAWGPAASWLLRENSDVVLSRGFVPEERWSFAVAVRDGDAELLERVNAAVSELVRSGRIRRIFEKYGTPYMPPSPTVSQGGH